MLMGWNDSKKSAGWRLPEQGTQALRSADWKSVRGTAVAPFRPFPRRGIEQSNSVRRQGPPG
jgi:hypothetical protein